MNKKKHCTVLGFLLVMGTVFYLTFGSLGPWLSKILAEGISWWVDKLSQLLTCFSVCDWVCSLILEGICPGVGSVLSFLPTMHSFFLSVYFGNLRLYPIYRPCHGQSVLENRPHRTIYDSSAYWIRLSLIHI